MNDFGKRAVYVMRSLEDGKIHAILHGMQAVFDYDDRMIIEPGELVCEQAN